MMCNRVLTASQQAKLVYSNQTGGLGLSFCSMVMEAFGSKITCEGEAGRYAKFTAHFPQKIPDLKIAANPDA